MSSFKFVLLIATTAAIRGSLKVILTLSSQTGKRYSRLLVEGLGLVD